MLSIRFSHIWLDTGTGCTFKDTQRVLKYLRHSESTGAFGHSEGTQRALGEYLGMWALGEHSKGIPAVKALVHSDT